MIKHLVMGADGRGRIHCVMLIIRINSDKNKAALGANGAGLRRLNKT